MDHKEDARIMERKGAVTMRGNAVTLIGPEIKVGEKAPNFTLTGNDMKPVTLADTTGKIRILSDGSPWRPIVHIEDISRAFIAALNAPRDVIHNRAFNVGRNKENYQIRDLAEIVKEAMPACTVEYAPDGGPDARCYRVTFDRISGELPDFKPEWDAKKGVRQLIEAYQKTDLALEDFEGSRYKRIDHIRELIASGRLDASLRWQTGV